MNLIFVQFIVMSMLLLGVASPALSASWWDMQVVDTMKYSRDLSREKLHDASFDDEIAIQMKRISEIGATHVGIATPYDEEFLPILRKWVAGARAEGLRVWFRGNWSGWEGWFEYPRIAREQHLQKTKDFLVRNVDLFEDGDIFSACPECENGGPGDPRLTGDVAGYRKFIIAQHRLAKNEFDAMGKSVASNWQSMNADVAKAVMDKETTRAMDGLVVIDHYVPDPNQVARDVVQIARQSGGNVALGEFGAPIPDLHGDLSEAQQAEWVDSALKDLSVLPDLVGLSYWTNMFGSTRLWNDDGSPREVVGVLKKYYTPKTIKGSVRGVWGRLVPNVRIVSSEGKETVSDSSGDFVIPYLRSPIDLRITHDNYPDITRRFTPMQEQVKIDILLASEGFFARANRFLCRILGYC